MKRKVHLVNRRLPKPKMLRVAGYARVSSGKDAMLHSLASQIDYFQNLIKNHAGWEFCGVYADEAMTGTNEERPQFQKMLEKCRNHEIDVFTPYRIQSNERGLHPQMKAMGSKRALRHFRQSALFISS